VKGENETITLNEATIAVKNRLFIPVRFFAVENDLDIQWDAAAQLVVIRNKVF
jgi:hypothetical protein